MLSLTQTPIHSFGAVAKETTIDSIEADILEEDPNLDMELLDDELNIEITNTVETTKMEQTKQPQVPSVVSDEESELDGPFDAEDLNESLNQENELENTTRNEKRPRDEIPVESAQISPTKKLKPIEENELELLDTEEDITNDIKVSEASAINAAMDLAKVSAPVSISQPKDAVDEELDALLMDEIPETITTNIIPATSQSNNEVNWSNLSEEVMLAIFTYSEFTWQDIFSVLLVCKKWHTTCKQNKFWEILFLQNARHAKNCSKVVQFQEKNYSWYEICKASCRLSRKLSFSKISKNIESEIAGMKNALMGSNAMNFVGTYDTLSSLMERLTPNVLLQKQLTSFNNKYKQVTYDSSLHNNQQVSEAFFLINNTYIQCTQNESALTTIVSIVCKSGNVVELVCSAPKNSNIYDIYLNENGVKHSLMNVSDNSKVKANSNTVDKLVNALNFNFLRNFQLIHFIWEDCFSFLNSSLFSQQQYSHLLSLLNYPTNLPTHLFTYSNTNTIASVNTNTTVEGQIDIDEDELDLDII